MGGFFSKHAYGVYSGRPPAGGFRCEDLAAAVRALPVRAYDTAYTGPARVETYTIAYERGQPARAVLAVRTPDEKRSWARSTEPAMLAALEREDWVGRPARVREDRSLDA